MIRSRLLRYVVIVVTVFAAFSSLVGDTVGDLLRPLVNPLAIERKESPVHRLLCQFPRRRRAFHVARRAHQQILEGDGGAAPRRFRLIVILVIILVVCDVPDREEDGYFFDFFAEWFDSSLMTSMISEATRPKSVQGTFSRFS